MISIVHRIGAAAAFSLPLLLLIPRADATPGICAFVYADANANGQLDQGEQWLSDWEICVTSPDGAVDCRQTGADGSACWFMIPQGTYRVCESLQDGWMNTTPLCVERYIRNEVAQFLFGNRQGGGPDRIQTPADAGQEESAPRFVLEQNAPNPVGPSTTIRFSLREAGEVRLSILDAAGRVVRELAGGQLAAGAHTVEWNGSDSGGDRVACGVYFYRLAGGGRVETRRLIILP